MTDARRPSPSPLMCDPMWREWKIKGCWRDTHGVLRLVIEDFDGEQRQVMGIEAHDWEPLGAVVGKGSS